MNNSELIRGLLKPKSQWIKDSEATHCFSCNRDFIPVIRWRHHCRFCGNVFCSKCVQNILYGEQIDYREEKRLRHCQKCRQRIKKIVSQDNDDFTHKSDLYDVSENILKLEIEQSTEISTLGDEESLTKHKIITEQITKQLQNQILRVALQLCDKYSLEKQTWQKRLADLALKTVNEVYPGSFVRQDYFSLLKQVRILTIITPKDCVTAACVKGLILERNIPSKQLQHHLKYPTIIIFKPALEAESLLDRSDIRFDTMVKNENSIMKNYLQKIYKLKPNIIFVAQHVSKIAFEQFLENQIMVISKVKAQDLRVIERLSLVKKVIDNLHLIDKYRPTDLIGVCEKVYFKNIGSGQMLMFIEQESGIRSILLGDCNQEINNKLKYCFSILLRIAWILKRSREVVIKDLKFQNNDNPLNLVIMQGVDWKSYDFEKSNYHLKMQGTKIVYKYNKISELPKAYQNYCLRVGHLNFLQICRYPQILNVQYYQGEDILLGTFLLKSMIDNNMPCKACQSFHIKRYFIDQYYVSIKYQGFQDRVISKMAFKAEQSDEEDQNESESKKPQSILVHEAIMKYFQKFKEKLTFFLFFKCEDCGQLIGNNKVKLGKDYLSIGFFHFLHELILLHKRKNIYNKEYQQNKKQYPCIHQNIIRTIQCPRLFVKFYVGKSIINQISVIILNQSMQKYMNMKDEKYLTEIYMRETTQKWRLIEEFQNQMRKMPFSLSQTTNVTSSISGRPSHQHIYYQYFIKLNQILNDLKIKIQGIQASYMSYFSQPIHDWTITLRKFYKIQYVLKLMFEILNFISNSLKKQKIEQTNNANQDNLIWVQPQQKRKSRKNSQQTDMLPRFNPPLTKFNSTQSMSSLIASMRKDTGASDFEEMDDIFKKTRKNRYPLYHGVYLYYPIGSINDPVSLLACCLNSEEFNDNLKEPNYKDFITCKMQFNKLLETEWVTKQQCIKLYQQVLKEQPSKNQNYQYTFSIYYHKQFQELRMSDGINFSLFIRSLYGCQSWDSSGGKSNSTFSKSHNEILVVKIINQKQFVEFQKFAPAYLKYMKDKRDNNDQSYLAKIYGIYEANIRNKIYKCVVMQNIFLGMQGPLKVYDLKGSQVNRLAIPVGDKSYTGLDTNFVMDKDGKPYILQEGIYDKTIKTFQQDAIFLKDQSVIDYSLLVIENQQVLRMGIIDFMRPYHFIEKIQTIYKEIKSGKDPTVIPPLHYSERFISAMKKYFIKVPRCC